MVQEVMMFGRSAMVLVTALLMFPQIVETIYSPALTDISRYFSVSAAEAAQTLSVYFIGFAVGVLYWGRFSDRYGRRPALLAGLATYALGCVLALAARDFTLLLVARILSAFGAATGSVVSQTILRDRFNGRQLAALFSMMGLVLAVSPAAGVYLGGAIVAGWGMHGVLTALALLAAVLLLLCCWLLPETRPPQHVHTAFLPLLRRMATDKSLALAVLLVAAFNVSLFSYYSLAPFISRSCVRERGFWLQRHRLGRRVVGRGAVQSLAAPQSRCGSGNIAARLSDTADQQRSGVLPGGYAAVPAADDGDHLRLRHGDPAATRHGAGRLWPLSGNRRGYLRPGLLCADWPRAGGGGMGAIAGWNADRERQRKLHRRATLWLLFARHAGGAT
jgi:MFS family permease